MNKMTQRSLFSSAIVLAVGATLLALAFPHAVKAASPVTQVAEVRTTPKADRLPQAHRVARIIETFDVANVNLERFAPMLAPSYGPTNLRLAYVAIRDGDKIALEKNAHVKDAPLPVISEVTTAAVP